jgi:hypothetical protein
MAVKNRARLLVVVCIQHYVCPSQGVRGNLAVALQYMEAWLRGNGCVPIHNLMEDAATAEISRLMGD